MRRLPPRLAAVLLALVLLCALLYAKDKVFIAPVAHHAKTYPAHEQQPNEHLSIAADPYDMADKAAIFGVNYRDAEFLPVLLIVSNDGDQPISLAKMKVELITVKKEKLAAADPDQIYRRITSTQRPDTGSGIPMPIPVPRKRKAGVKAEAREEISAAQFKALAVEPKTTHSGFFFFDFSGISNPLAGARLYITGLRNAEGQEILYFEIPMEKYLTYQPQTP